MNMLTEDIKDLLLEAGEGLVFAQSLFIGMEPSRGNTVTIFDTSGLPPVNTYKRAETWYQGAVSIRVRNASLQAATSLAERLAAFLNTKTNLHINGTWYGYVRPIDSPFLLDWDQANRARVVFNVEAARRASTALHGTSGSLFPMVYGGGVYGG